MGFNVMEMDWEERAMSGIALALPFMLLILMVIWRQSVAEKWKDRAFECKRQLNFYLEEK